MKLAQVSVQTKCLLNVSTWGTAIAGWPTSRSLYMYYTISIFFWEKQNLKKTKKNIGLFCVDILHFEKRKLFNFFFLNKYIMDYYFW